MSFHTVSRCEQPITCGDSEPEPDVSLVYGEEASFRHDHPHTAALVLEVCVTSHEYDRSKLTAYANAGVKEVWYVLAPEKQIEVHRHAENGRYTELQTLGPGGRVASSAVPAVVVDLDDLFED